MSDPGREAMSEWDKLKRDSCVQNIVKSHDFRPSGKDARWCLECGKYWKHINHNNSFTTLREDQAS